MDKITLAQLLQYFEMEDEPVEKIQIVSAGQEWDYADELYGNSELLHPFRNCIITDISCEESYDHKNPIIRVGIRTE